MRNQKGFTLVEGLLIILVVAVVGLGGYYVWNQQQEDEPEQTETTQVEDSTQPEEDSGEEEIVTYTPEGYILYTNDTYKLLFSYPQEWGAYAEETAPEGVVASEYFKSQPASENVSRVSTLRVNMTENYTWGGAFGPELKLNENNLWEVVGGRYSEDRIGEIVELDSQNSDSGIKVFNVVTGDGPFSARTLIFEISNEKILEINLPSVCPDSECSDYENSYTSEQVKLIADNIIRSVKIY